jgi:site-specific recombinase XerD
MGIDLIAIPPAPLAALHATAERARAYAEQAKATNTRRAYQADWRDITAWCDLHQLVSLPAPPATVALYLTDLAERGRSVATLARRIATISQAHQTAHVETPTKAAEVRAVMRGIRREKGTAQRQKTAAVTRIIRAMVDQLPGSVSGLRDRALLLMGSLARSDAPSWSAWM